MAETISLEEAFGQPAAPGTKREAGGGEVISLEEAFGEAKPQGVVGFLRDPQARREMAGNLAGVGAQLSDMFTGLGKSLLGSAAYLLERGQSKGAGVKAAPLAAYDGPKLPVSDTGAQKRSAAEAQRVKDMFPEELAAPWRVVAENLGPEALRAYNENGVGWVMGKLGEIIEHGGEKAQSTWGIPASDVVNLIDLTTGVIGAATLKPQAQMALRQRLSKMKAANTPRDLNPEEMAAAYEGTKRFRPGDTTTARPSDFEATQEVQMPQLVVPPKRKAKSAPAKPKAQALLDELDPYKVPVAAGAAVGASAWMMQNELSDEQLAGLGLLGVAGMVKLKGVPEANLIEMLKQGGPGREAAAAQIYRDNVPMLARSLQKYAKQGVEIEDVVQRTMEKGLRAIEKGQFAGNSAIQTYLYRIADNEAKMNLRYEKVRPRTESLDTEERPGVGKGDESLPSPHEQVADESITGRSPEQVAQDRALAGAMSAALDRLPENFRKPFEMRELEGMDYAEIAEALGQPIGTVRSQINRAKEALQKSLREYGKTAAGAGLVAGVAALADPDDYEELGLGIAALGAIKAKGGMWHPKAVSKLANAFPPDFLGPSTADMQTARNWAEKSVKNYLNKHAGTATDPLKDIELPDGTRWEDAMDQAIGSRPAKDFGKGGSQGAIKGLNKLRAEGKVSADEPIYDIGYENWPRQFGHRGENVGQSVTRLKDYLRHVGDYILQNVADDKLGQYDLVRAVKETKAWDDQMAKEAAKAAEREANAALQRMKTMTTVQEFPGGLRLVKLDKPGDFAHESTVMGHSVRGYEPHAAPVVTPDEWLLRIAPQYLYDQLLDVPTPLEGLDLIRAIEAAPEYQDFKASRTGAHPDWIPASEKGADTAKFGSGHPDYGLGGWDAIKRGDAEILSLRDAKGQSHVTIEVATPQYLESLNSQIPGPQVLQIRGKGNAPVPERYQQAIADFLNSRKWGEVGDLDNAGLVDTADVSLRVKKALGEQRYVTRAQVREVMDAYNEGRLDAEGNISPPPRDVLGGNQAGRASPEMLFTLAATAGGATLGAFLAEDQPLMPALYGALAGGFMATAAGRGSVKEALKAGARKADYVAGLTSTRLGKIAPELKARYRDHERRVLKALDTTYDQTAPFLSALAKQPKAVQDLIARELLNGKTAALNAIPELRAAYPKVRATLANIEGQLQALGRFGEGVGNYFPRIVKDYPALKAALDQPVREGLEKALAEAEAAMIRKRGRPLTEVEQSVVTNRYLFAEGPNASMPGYAHGRKVKEVTEKLQPFYEAPAESLLRYLTGSIRDIEAARFFGKDLKTNAKGERVFNNIDESIGELVSRLQREKQLSPQQVQDLRAILKSRFEGGEKSMSPGLAMVRDLTNAGLLGNFTSAATQIGDSMLSIYHFGLVPTLQGVVQRVRGTSLVTPKDLGLINHVAEELSGKRIPGEVLHQTLKWSGFQAIDQFAKGISINAALAKAKAQARTAKGQVALTERYGYAFGDEMPQLLDDLRAGRNTTRTQTLAFEALSDIQPVSKAEMPQAYLDHPNGRILYQLKTYMLKQFDVVRREAYDNIASGDPKKLMRGVKNLAALGTVYALANVPGDVIKDLLSGRDSDPFTTPALVENVLATFGMNRYNQGRLSEGKVVETGVGFVTPPLRVLEDIALGRDKSFAYIPLVGRPVYERFLGGNERREISEKRQANKGKPPSETEALSDEAKAYLLEKRMERARKKLEAEQ